MITPALLGPIDILAEEVVGGVTIIEFILLALVTVNLAIRAFAHRGYVTAARRDGADAISRSLVLDVTNVLIVLGGFYYITIHVHGGVVFTILAIGLLVTDFFEFEARLVEARNELPIERPKGALFASTLVFAYIAYQSLFFLIQPFWDSVF
ncbi:hypothetical protein OB955_17770 [Halobacteria archaeon AArc-m2/3/4]|uniref:DUF7313 domain-containing protein n=1 Tax=Natronoglomus mannanivorans TaxID=2979990 RepID=A0AAP2YYK2_9EURY|nr:hypothetical protein [Halobacteria archaeon AArc-xg1-1]MCU4974571.1 hypothetical protein [Halobacteria archaeon AArc-m2/3/4]